MHTIQGLLENSNLPLLSAFLLGLITSISPCPLATNITAIAFISREIESKKRVFYNGLIYMLGGAISYSALGIILFLGANQFKIATFFQRYGGRIIGPLLILIGIIMLDVIKLNLFFSSNFADTISKKSIRKQAIKSFLLGIVFALAFCPYTGVLFFGMLMPMTISSASGLYLPIVFAIGACLPFVIVAYLVAFTISGVGGFYDRVKVFEVWFRRIVAVIFIVAGI